MSGEELRERLAEALSVVEGEMTTYSPDAHPDHNRWSWRGDGHSDVIRGRYYALADEALAVVLPERDALRAQVDRARALADEWIDSTLKGDCPDGLCGSCTQGNDAQLLRAALDGPQ